MNKMILFAILMSATVAGWCNEDEPTHFVIIVPSYNNEKWCEKNLHSVFSQSYANWSLYYLDEGSFDTTYQKVQDYIRKHHRESQCTVVQNKEKNARMKNIFQAIHQCKPTDVIVMLDGCDWLSHAHVLRTLADIYANPRVWVTYRAVRADNPRCWGDMFGSFAYSSTNTRRRLFKARPWFRMSLRTFYAGLFQQIHIQDLQVQQWYVPTCGLQNEFLPVSSDAAMMFPILEMASAGHLRYVQEKLYEYNVNNLSREEYVYQDLRRTIKEWIVENQRVYPALNSYSQNVVFGPNDETLQQLLERARKEDEESERQRLASQDLARQREIARLQEEFLRQQVEIQRRIQQQQVQQQRR